MLWSHQKSVCACTSPTSGHCNLTDMGVTLHFKKYHRGPPVSTSAWEPLSYVEYPVLRDGRGWPWKTERRKNVSNRECSLQVRAQSTGKSGISRVYKIPEHENSNEWVDLLCCHWTFSFHNSSVLNSPLKPSLVWKKPNTSHTKCTI